MAAAVVQCGTEPEPELDEQAVQTGRVGAPLPGAPALVVLPTRDMSAGGAGVHEHAYDGREPPTLEMFVPSAAAPAGQLRPAVLVCPGGAYKWLNVAGEGTPAAEVSTALRLGS
jgi:hypothetical protein